MANTLGTFEYDADEDRGIISLLDSQGKDNLIDTFCEEWAHARCNWLLDLEEASADPHHHPTFWAEYGRIQQAVREIAW
jgi:hypothetical protein